jgi:serine/threonine-protein kinase RsbW
MEQVKQDLRLSSKLESLSLIEGLVDDLCDKYKINDDYYGNILIALTEAVTNAIVHGNQKDSKKHVDVQISKEDHLLCFKIKDEGPGFDPSNLPDPTAPENIENPSGRGIFLIKNLADVVDFEDGGRTLKIAFNIA